MVEVYLEIHLNTPHQSWKYTPNRRPTRKRYFYYCIILALPKQSDNSPFKIGRVATWSFPQYDDFSYSRPRRRVLAHAVVVLSKACLDWESRSARWGQKKRHQSIARNYRSLHSTWKRGLLVRAFRSAQGDGHSNNNFRTVNVNLAFFCSPTLKKYIKYIKGSVYLPDCPIQNASGSLRAFKSPYSNASRVNSNTLNKRIFIVPKRFQSFYSNTHLATDLL